MSGARVVKTPDELECLKISSAIGDTSFWKIEHEWLKPGVKESYITAKVNEYLYEHGFDFVYDIIVASGGNTSPYRRWHTDKVIREGDLVIVDQNAVGPGGYFVDFVRCFKVGGPLDGEGEGPLQGVLRVDVRRHRRDEGRQHDRGRRRASSPSTPTTSSARSPSSSSRTRSASRSTRACGSRARTRSTIRSSSRRTCTSPPRPSPATPGLEQTVRLEENLLVTKDGPVIFTKHPFDDEALL